MPSSSREAAFEVLNRCCNSCAWSAQTLDTIIKRFSLDRRDASLAYRISLGVLQNRTLLDYYIDSFLQEGKKLDDSVRNVLRIGAYQILFNDRIPPRAAVNESVELCKQSRKKSASGLVNAVLRRIADNKTDLPPIPSENEEQYLAIKYSHPIWFCHFLMEEFGRETAEKILQYNNASSPMTLQVNTLKTTQKDFCRLLDAAEKEYTIADEQSVFLFNSPVTEIPGYREGLFYVQDNAARRSVDMLDLKGGETVLDACAAPGGKTFAAAIGMKNTGKIISCDIHEKKLKLIEESTERLGISIVSTRAADSKKFIPEYRNFFDAVIADVPCSGYGVIAQKPEIRFKKREESEGLPKIQREILENVSDYVSQGGRLLYSTCTLLREENGDIVRGFLESHDEFKLMSEKLYLPGEGESSGFYAACMERRST